MRFTGVLGQGLSQYNLMLPLKGQLEARRHQVSDSEGNIRAVAASVVLRFRTRKTGSDIDLVLGGITSWNQRFSEADQGSFNHYRVISSESAKTTQPKEIMPVDNTFLAGVGQSPTQTYDNKSITLETKGSEDGRFNVDPKGLGNIHRDTVKDQAARYTKAHNITHAESVRSCKTLDLESDDSDSSQKSSKRNGACQQEGPCVFCGAVESCSCFTETRVDQNSDQFVEVRQRVLAGAPIVDYPVVRVFDVAIDMEDLYRKFWGYKQDQKILAAKRGINW
ncbi:hypothetical protein QBC44DRAFT_308020 [Cladorrhinum sp. PSN332]|nr:hypothetical protein QBC44DRAFT_308020 [Cladorrhinum sp. PSN332]